MCANDDQNEGQKLNRRKLKGLVITMGSTRQKQILDMFATPAMAAHFESPSFSPGVPQRELRNRLSFLLHAGKAGILPEEEWNVIQTSAKSFYEKDPAQDWVSECLQNIPVQPDRKGRENDKNMHYAAELWSKAKSINRGRSVLACTFAHLVAMKTQVEQGYDFILEDNVRAPCFLRNQRNDSPESTDDQQKYTESKMLKPMLMHQTDYEQIDCECAERIWGALQASQQWERVHHRKCHLRYYGWLGSRPNLEFVIKKYIPRKKITANEEFLMETFSEGDNCFASIFPFPITSDFDSEDNDSSDGTDGEKQVTSGSTFLGHTKAGGTPIWGAYAYWISSDGYNALVSRLQKDVGALLWKGKRMRFYMAKPIDKVMPRHILAAFPSCQDLNDRNNDRNANDSHATDTGRECIHLATYPAFFRAPMLTSTIHSQYDAEFCRSTEYQLIQCRKPGQNNMTPNIHVTIEDGDCWDDLWLSAVERKIVDYRKKTNDWLTEKEIEFGNIV